MGDRVAAQRCMDQAAALAKDPSNPQKLQLTYQLYQSAAITDPTLGEAFYEVGNANQGLNAFPGAIGAYRRALECNISDDLRAKTWTNMAHLLYHTGRVDEAKEFLEQAIALRPDFSLPHLNMSMCLQSEGKLDESLASAQSGFDLEPSHPAVEMGLAFAHLFAGNYSLGLKHFEARFPYKLTSFLYYPFPKWLGEEGKQVFLVADQGIGDTLSFARFVPRAAKRAKFLHMAVQPELVRLFSAMFQKIPNINILANPCPWPPAEAWTTFMSLPFALGLNDEEIINAKNAKIPRFAAPSTSWKSPDRKLHIGVMWSGSPANEINKWRSFPLEYLLELYKVSGIQLYSLQVGERSADLHASGCATLLRDLGPLIRDISDTMGILEHLDLVISCESVLPHICAMMGKKCYVAYSYHGRDFRIGYDGSRRLWCPEHVIFKQGKDAQWGPVFDQIGAVLEEQLRIREVTT